MYRLKKAAVLLLAMLMCTSAFGCGGNEQETMSSPDIEATETNAPAPSDEAVETDPVPETAASETEPETEPPLPDDAELVGTPEPEIYETEAETDASIETAAAETEPAETEPPRIYNYLNGVTTTEEEQQKRPVAIMMNNIKNCLPQNNITKGDIFYECAAEGGITRIMMLVSDYESLGEVGSIRSSRDYFVDFLDNHDAIYVHAGGSEMAYDKILWRGTNNLDGVNMYVPDMFYRDEYRKNNMGLEHSLMTTGPKIAAGIAYKDYRTELKDNFVPTFRFYDENTDFRMRGSIATHVHMKSTSIQTVDFVYNSETGEYLRYQYNGMPQVDGITGEQLSVKNVIILFTDINPIPGDTAGRLSVETVGSGEGYYITNGRRRVISWSRADKNAPLQLTYRDGGDLTINSGKTFVCVVDHSVTKNLEFAYSWN